MGRGIEQRHLVVEGRRRGFEDRMSHLHVIASFSH